MITAPRQTACIRVQVGRFLNVATSCGGSLCEANFLDTVTITGASVYTTGGALVSGATLVSESGFNPNAAPAPEPSSVLLLGTGLLALIGAAKLKLLVS
jgi:hypothetical protein